MCVEGLDVRAFVAERGHRRDVGRALVPSIPTTFSIVRRQGVLYGNIWTSEAAPVGLTTQYTKFDFRAIAYSGTLEHLPVVLFLDAAALGETPAQLVGNGLLVGDVSLTTNGCGSVSAPGSPAYNSQYEAFWRGGNYLWSTSCAPAAVVDGMVYSFELHASTGSWLWYQRSIEGAAEYSAPSTYTLDNRPSFDATQGGTFFGSTNMYPGSDFTLEFSNVKVDWF
jgi:hypothetical protein